MTKNFREDLAHAIQANDIEHVKALLGTCATPIHVNVLLSAAYEGRLEIVKLLIPHCNPKDKNSWPLRSAVQHGWIDCVRVLMPVSDIKAEKSAALIMAAGKGFTEIVKLLLPHSSPKAQKSKALGVAVQQGHHACVELLYPVSHPIAALKELQLRFPNRPEKWQILEDRMQSERQRKRLQKVVGENEITHTKKM